tara:strand:+ start:101 stop:391 length:291 start_codon:yes stop_codon:yes gene_type:complete
MTLKNLDFLTELTNLKELNFMLGGTKNLEALPKIGKIEKLSFTWVRQLTIEHLEVINKMKFLKEISFDRQAHLTDMSWFTKPNIKVDITNCKNYRE